MYTSKKVVWPPERLYFPTNAFHPFYRRVMKSQFPINSRWNLLKVDSYVESNQDFDPQVISYKPDPSIDWRQFMIVPSTYPNEPREIDWMKVSPSMFIEHRGPWLRTSLLTGGANPDECDCHCCAGHEDADVIIIDDDDDDDDATQPPVEETKQYPIPKTIDLSQEDEFGSDTEDQKRNRSMVPDWAKEPALSAALAAQTSKDPDKIFAQPEDVRVDVDEIFASTRPTKKAAVAETMVPAAAAAPKKKGFVRTDPDDPFYQQQQGVQLAMDPDVAELVAASDAKTTKKDKRTKKTPPPPPPAKPAMPTPRASEATLPPSSVVTSSDVIVQYKTSGDIGRVNTSAVIPLMHAAGEFDIPDLPITDCPPLFNSPQSWLGKATNQAITRLNAWRKEIAAPGDDVLYISDYGVSFAALYPLFTAAFATAVGRAPPEYQWENLVMAWFLLLQAKSYMLGNLRPLYGNKTWSCPLIKVLFFYENLRNNPVQIDVGDHKVRKLYLIPYCRQRHFVLYAIEVYKHTYTVFPFNPAGYKYKLPFDEDPDLNKIASLLITPLTNGGVKYTLASLRKARPDHVSFEIPLLRANQLQHDATACGIYVCWYGMFLAKYGPRRIDEYIFQSSLTEYRHDMLPFILEMIVSLCSGYWMWVPDDVNRALGLASVSGSGWDDQPPAKRVRFDDSVFDDDDDDTPERAPSLNREAAHSRARYEKWMELASAASLTQPAAYITSENLGLMPYDEYRKYTYVLLDPVPCNGDMEAMRIAAWDLAEDIAYYLNHALEKEIPDDLTYSDNPDDTERNNRVERNRNALRAYLDHNIIKIRGYYPRVVDNVPLWVPLVVIDTTALRDQLKWGYKDDVWEQIRENVIIPAHAYVENYPTGATDETSVGFGFGDDGPPTKRAHFDSSVFDDDEEQAAAPPPPANPPLNRAAAQVQERYGVWQERAANASVNATDPAYTGPENLGLMPFSKYRRNAYILVPLLPSGMWDSKGLAGRIRSQIADIMFDALEREVPEELTLFNYPQDEGDDSEFEDAGYRAWNTTYNNRDFVRNLLNRAVRAKGYYPILDPSTGNYDWAPLVKINLPSLRDDLHWGYNDVVWERIRQVAIDNNAKVENFPTGATDETWVGFGKI